MNQWRARSLIGALVVGVLYLAGCGTEPLQPTNNTSANNTTPNNTSANNTTPNNTSTNNTTPNSTIPTNNTTPNNTAANTETRGQILPPSQDPTCEDADGDGYYAACPGGTDCHDGNAEVNPGAMEVCDDNLDNDCKEGGDTLCPCDTEGEERPCYPGPAGTVGVGACRVGTQRCQGGVWRACEGSVKPLGEVCNGEDDDCDGAIDEEVAAACGGCGVPAGTTEQCGNQVDDDCDGDVDEDCICESSFGECYAGPPETRGKGECKDGMRACDGEEWGPCEGSVLPVGEVCGDGLDNDCDGEADEGCANCLASEVCDGLDNDCDGVIDNGCLPCLDVGKPGSNKPWEIHIGAPPLCWDLNYERHGDPIVYTKARIPAADDPGWMPEDDNRISFSDPSTLCGQNGAPDLCECRKGGDFTYFQTFFNVTPVHQIDSLEIEIKSVDDGARITIFNNDHPNGVVDDNSYAYFPSGSSTNLAGYIVNGQNRIVITHVDDCCAERRIEDVIVRINDQEIVLCED